MLIRNFIIVGCIALTGCANMTAQQRTITKSVVTIAVVGVVAGAVGRSNQASHCANNRAGFWVDNSTGHIYTCP